MNAKQHALHARLLIEACGGLIEAASNQKVRVEKTSLARYCDAESGVYMPADVMFELERYAQRPIYSRAITEAQAAGVVLQDLVAGACETTEGAAALMKLIRTATADHKLTPAERNLLRRAMAPFKQLVLDLEGAIETAGDQ